MEQPTIVSINISTQRGVRKTPVESAELIPDHGIKTDAHAGDWHRQISLLAQESIDKMKAKGADVHPGDFAENITIKGMELFTLPVGTRIKLGPVETEVTQIGKECHHGCEIRRLTGDCVMPREGIFVIVLNPGSIKIGDPVELLSKPVEVT